jgi:hypothetical protein
MAPALQYFDLDKLIMIEIDVCNYISARFMS